ncbi:MAG: alpha/beta hydrolase [Pseudomonadota bacterium]
MDWQRRIGLKTRRMRSREGASGAPFSATSAFAPLTPERAPRRTAEPAALREPTDCGLPAEPSLINLARNPVPSGAVVNYVPGYDGKPMRFARWEATRGSRRGTVCVFPGRSEFIEKYFEVVADLRRRGFAVVVTDWRGQGGSARALPDRAKGHIRNFAEYERDMARLMKEVVLPDCPPPYYALAHSMGGNIMLHHATQKNSWFDRIVLSAPMVALAAERMPVPETIARRFARTATMVGAGTAYVPGGKPEPFEFGPFEENPLTSDQARYERNAFLSRSAVELTLGSPTNAWLAAAFRSMERLQRVGFAREIRVPMLIMAAGEDRIVDTRRIEELSNRLKIGAAVVIPRAQHELLQETDDVRLRFWAAFDAYLGVDERID